MDGRSDWLAGAAVAGLAMMSGAVGTPAARAQGLPPGSYQKTCTVLGVDSARGVMTASCKEKSGDRGFSTWVYVVYPPALQAELIPDKQAGWGMNRDFPYADCLSPIDNLDGKLFCTIDQAKAAARLKAEADAKAAQAADAAQKAKIAADLKYQLDMNEQFAAATPGLRAAAALIIGRDMGNEEARYMLGVARALSHPQSRAAIMAKEFDFGAAGTFLRGYLAKSGGEPYRNGAIDAAFFQVYGRPSTPQEQIACYAQIAAGKAWYATIVGDEMKKIPAGAATRDEIVVRVAKNAYGRDPQPPEAAEGKASGQNYGTMVEGARQRLWSGADPDALVQTVSAALATLGRPATPEAVKAAVAAWRPMTPVYAEMISPAGRARVTAALGNGRPPLIRR